jgi:cytochrome P450
MLTMSLHLKVLTLSLLVLLLGSVDGFSSPFHGRQSLSNNNLLLATTLLTTDQESTSFVEPILDSSYSKNPIKRVTTILTSLKWNEAKTIVHDRSLNETGGVWKSRLPGRQAYCVSAYLPEMAIDLTKLEAKGYLQNSWPQSVVNVLGPNSLIAADVDSEDFQTARKTFSTALSTKSILSQSLPGIEQSVDDMLQHWNRCADEGQITTFSKDVSAITYSVITTAVFGPNSLTEKEMKSLRQWSDTIAKGLFSLRIKNRIMRKIPFLRRYPRAMKAREEMKTLLIEKIAQRKLAIQSAADLGSEFRPTGMLDVFLLAGGLGEDKVVEFCVDNVILSIFAGFDTTASLCTNLILLLHDYATADELAQIRAELNEFDIRSSPSSTPGGILDAVPSLKSAVYESFRFRPVVGSTFRKTTHPICWSTAHIY